LEEALPDVGHDSLVLPDSGWNSYEGAELRWEINVLSFLTDFKQRLVH
jgi:hypothetical protein